MYGLFNDSKLCIKSSTSFSFKSIFAFTAALHATVAINLSSTSFTDVLSLLNISSNISKNMLFVFALYSKSGIPFIFNVFSPNSSMSNPISLNSFIFSFTNSISLCVKFTTSGINVN